MLFAKPLEETRCDGDLALFARLAVVEPNVAVELRLRFARVADVDDERLEGGITKDVDALFEPLGVEEIANQDGDAAALVLGDERLQRVTQIGSPGRLQPAEKLEHFEDALFAPRRVHRRGDALAHRRDRDAIEVREGDVRERGGDLLRIAELLAVAEPHRGRGVDDDVDREVLFFLEEAHCELVEALIEVPIEVPEVVSFGVVAVIDELDATAALLRLPLGLRAPGEDALRDDREVFELALELVVEEVVVRAGRGGLSLPEEIEESQLTPSPPGAS